MRGTALTTFSSFRIVDNNLTASLSGSYRT